MLTPPALHHLACLPDVWACVPNWHDMTPPFPVVQLSGMLASLSNVCWSFPLSMHVPLTVAFVTVRACVLVIIDIEPLTHLIPMEDLEACLNILRGHCSFYLGCPFSLLPTVAIGTRYNLTCIPPVSGPVFLTIVPSHFFFLNITEYSPMPP